MKDQQDEKKVLQKAQMDEGEKSRRLVFIGQKPVLTAQALYTSCCIYVSAHSHRHHK